MWLPIIATRGIGRPVDPNIATDFVSNRRERAALGNARLRAEIKEKSSALKVGSFPDGPSDIEGSTA
jgi:hypothetical protein